MPFSLNPLPILYKLLQRLPSKQSHIVSSTPIANNQSEELSDDNIVKTIDKAEILLDKMPKSGSIEAEDISIIENDPQAALKVDAPQVNLDASASYSKKFTRIRKVKITKF